ncbi:hypothetical protein QEN19_003078 [Hanseniaspora menglaensis]
MVKILFNLAADNDIFLSTETVFMTGSFNDWNNQEYKLEFDCATNSYNTEINVAESNSKLVIKFFNASQQRWFSLPNHVLEIDTSNSDSNNILFLKDLPFKNEFLLVNKISTQKTPQIIKKPIIKVFDKDTGTKPVTCISKSRLSKEIEKQDADLNPQFIVLQDETENYAEDDFEVSTPTEMIKSESYTNILLSNSTNDMNSIESFAQRRPLSSHIKLNLESKSSNAAITEPHVFSTRSNNHGLKSLFKKVMGYK